MSIGNIKDYTLNYKFIIPRFDIATWHDYIESNFRSIDAMLYYIFAVKQYKGEWLNSTNYVVGDVLFINGGDYDSRLVKVLTNHTTPSAPTTFDEYLSTHPEYYDLYVDASGAEQAAQNAHTYMNNAQNYANLARDWARSMDGKVENVDYSAKYYAQLAADTVRNNSANKSLSNLNSEGLARFAEKQNVIADLNLIRQGAGLGSTAAQRTELHEVAFTGSYNVLTNKPSIPTKTSDLNNDSFFVTIYDADDRYARLGGVNTFTYSPNVPDVDIIAAPSSYAANTKYVHDYVGTNVLHLYSHGSEIGRFSANATSDVTIDLNIPTRVSQLTDAASYATQVWVSTTYASKSYVNELVGDIETLLSQV